MPGASCGRGENELDENEPPAGAEGEGAGSECGGGAAEGVAEQRRRGQTEQEDTSDAG